MLMFDQNLTKFSKMSILTKISTIDQNFFFLKFRFLTKISSFLKCRFFHQDFEFSKKFDVFLKFRFLTKISSFSKKMSILDENIDF